MADSQKQLVEAFKRAVATVDEAKVPKDLREIAFKAALAGMNVSTGEDQKVTLPSSISDGGGGDAENGGGDSGDLIDKLARKLKCDLDATKLAFEFDEGDAHLLVAASDLDSKSAAAQQEVALLTLAARQGSGMEEWTSAKVIRDMAQNLGVYESNHSTYVGELKGRRVRIKGKGQGRELKLNQPGFEEAAALVSRLAEST
jgi:hypothetical protein